MRARRVGHAVSSRRGGGRPRLRTSCCPRRPFFAARVRARACIAMLRSLSRAGRKLARGAVSVLRSRGDGDKCAALLPTSRLIRLIRFPRFPLLLHRFTLPFSRRVRRPAARRTRIAFTLLFSLLRAACPPPSPPAWAPSPPSPRPWRPHSLCWMWPGQAPSWCCPTSPPLPRPSSRQPQPRASSSYPSSPPRKWPTGRYAP